MCNTLHLLGQLATWQHGEYITHKELAADVSALAIVCNTKH